jgi:hypothetical protein
MRLVPARRRGVASIIGTLLFVIVLLAGLAALGYMDALQNQSTQAGLQAQQVQINRAMESLLYATGPQGLTVTNSGTSSVNIVGMVMKFSNQTAFALTISQALASGGTMQVSPMVGTGSCGGSTCLARYDSLVGSVTAGNQLGLVTSNGNTFWYVPSTSGASDPDVYRTLATQTTLSSTWVPITGLNFSGSASTTYQITVSLFYSQSTGTTNGGLTDILNGIHFGVSIPAGAIMAACGGVAAAQGGFVTNIANNIQSAIDQGCTSSPDSNIGPTNGAPDAAGYPYNRCTSECQFVAIAYVSLGSAGGAVQLEWLMSSSGDLGTLYADSMIQVTPTLSAVNSAGIAPTVSLNPASGTVGSTVTVTGSGFTANSPISMLWGTTYGGTTYVSQPFSPPCTSGPTGSFSCTFTLPASTHGVHSVIVTDTDGYSAFASFTVNNYISVSPTSGPASTTITVTGTGFAYAPSYSITITDAGVTQTTTPSSCVASSVGSFSCSFVPSGAAATGGTHTITASDPVGDSASASFTVTATLAISPASGSVGTTVTVSGTGYVSNAGNSGYPSLTVTFDGVAITTSPTQCTANVYGVLNSCTFTVPASTAGAHTVKVADGSGNSATASFTTTSSISISPSSEPSFYRNTAVTITVTGTGFASGSAITVKYDGTAQTTSPTSCVTSSTGGFTCSITITSVQGSHTVLATDASGDSASATYTQN